MSLDSSAFRPLRPARNLTGELINRLTEEIVAGKLAPRTRLPTEHGLMDAFGVSRTVVREAIAALRAEGLVETRQGSGAFVAADSRRRPFRIDPDDLKSIAQVVDVMELRICVEAEAAGLAAARRLKPDLERIGAIADRFSRAVAKADPAIDLDFQFHVAIGGATGNPYFSSFLDFIGRLIIPRRTIPVDRTDPDEAASYLRRLDLEHRAIERAIADGNVAGARRAMRSHLRRGRERYRRLTENVRPSGRERRG
jgi:GntR family transcriptional repressor for pyruvate dehydrogenase complex